MLSDITFMEKVGLDVFQFILSFLPPVPYLFQLQRVSKHYAQLCSLCMEEDCSELYWDEEAVSEMNDLMKQSSNRTTYNNTMKSMLMLLKPTERCWVLFFRDILHKFKKLDRLVLKNMAFTDLITYIIFVDWKGKVKELKLIQCDFSVVLPCTFCVGNSDQQIDARMMAYTHIDNIVDVKLDDSYDSLSQQISNSANAKNIEKFKYVAKSNTTLPYNGYPFIPFLKCLPMLKSVRCPIFRSSTPVWQSAALLFPDIDFEPLPNELAQNENFPERFYLNYICKEFNLRKNRLDLMRDDLPNKSSGELHNFFGSLIDFLDLNAPFGIDTKVKNIRGDNIIQLAILFSNYETVKFLLKYLTVLEDRDQATRELTQLFSANNNLDGKNVVFKCLTSNPAYFNLMAEYKVSFNLPAQDGSTILHSLCSFGQLFKFQSLWETTLKGMSLEEKKYFLDFTLKNKKGETPLLLCKKNGMYNMLHHLKSHAETLGIDLEKEEDYPPCGKPLDDYPNTTMVPTTVRTDNTTGKCKIL